MADRRALTALRTLVRNKPTHELATSWDALVWVSGEIDKVLALLAAEETPRLPPDELAAQVFDRWRVTVKGRPGGFTHEDGVTFLRMLREAFAPLCHHGWDLVICPRGCRLPETPETFTARLMAVPSFDHAIFTDRVAVLAIVREADAEVTRLTADLEQVERQRDSLIEDERRVRHQRDTHKQRADALQRELDALKAQTTRPGTPSPYDLSRRDEIRRKR